MTFTDSSNLAASEVWPQVYVESYSYYKLILYLNFVILWKFHFPGLGLLFLPSLFIVDLLPMMIKFF